MQVQEAVVGAAARSRMPELGANLASIQLAQQHFQSAERLYGAAAARIHHASPSLLLHLARTVYHANQVQHEDCKHTASTRLM